LFLVCKRVPSTHLDAYIGFSIGFSITGHPVPFYPEGSSWAIDRDEAAFHHAKSPQSENHRTYTMGDRLGLEPDGLVHDVALDLEPRPPE
jgi:hypothetical protein